MTRWCFWSLLIVTLIIVVVLLVVVDNNDTYPQRRRRRLKEENKNENVDNNNNSVNNDAAAALLLLENEYHALAQHLCPESGQGGGDTSTYPSLPYHNCQPDAMLDVIPFFGGMTNGLKFVLLGSLTSFQYNRCFIVTEKNAHLNPGFANHSNTDILQLSSGDGFTKHYFETIGLAHDDPFVLNAIETGRYRVRSWEEYWYDGWSRKMKFLKFNFDQLGYVNVDGHSLKRNYLHRMWRLKPHYRDQTCTTLREKKIGGSSSPEEKQQYFFVAYSVRRGDKSSGDMRSNHLPPMELYINVTEVVLNKKQIKIIAPTQQQVTIFVATDDCTVLTELQQLRPKWNFVSACPSSSSYDDNSSSTSNGYHITDVPQWTTAQREEHFTKFFVELYALTLAPLFIGVSYTNVAWWVYFMKPIHLVERDFILLDLLAGGAEKKGEFLRQW